MSTLDDLDDWLADLTPQAPVSRQMAPAIPTTVLLGYIALWHNRTCDSCGSEHLEFAGAYECFRHPSGTRSAKLTHTLPDDSPLPVLHRKVQRTAPHCAECFEAPEPTEETILTLASYESLLV